MQTRLFHAVILCGTALGVSSGCGSLRESARGAEPRAYVPGGASIAVHQERCRLPDGSCNEHCRMTANGTCLDPCFVHTKTCAAPCLRPDGTCGWPPTK